MVLITTGKIVNSLSTSVRKIVKDLTGFNLGKRISKVTSATLNNIGKLVKKVPIAGGIVAYVFRHSSKGVTIVLTSADNLVSKSGKVVNKVFKGATDIAVYSLNTVSNTIGVGTKKTKKYKGKRRGKSRGKSRGKRRGGRKTRRRRRR